MRQSTRQFSAASIHSLRRIRDRIDLEEQFEIFARLRERREQLAGTLSGGEQQMRTIACALMSRPKFLLLDEPSLGLAPIIVRDISRIIDALKAKGVTILLTRQTRKLGAQAQPPGGLASELQNDERGRAPIPANPSDCRYK